MVSTGATGYFYHEEMKIGYFDNGHSVSPKLALGLQYRSIEDLNNGTKVLEELSKYATIELSSFTQKWSFHTTKAIL